MWIQVYAYSIQEYTENTTGMSKGRLSVSYISRAHNMTYMIGLTYILAASEVGQPLMVCRQDMSQLSKRCDGHK